MASHGRIISSIAAGLALTVAAAVSAAPGAGERAQAYDLDGDGRQELVVGLPWFTQDGEQASGAVAVVRGDRALLGDAHVITRASLGVEGANRYGAAGAGIASADFDADGYADLAIGVPGDAAVAIRYGAADLSGRRTALIRDNGADFSAFGAALAAGYVDGDAYADLVIADTAADPQTDADSGSGELHVVRGGPEGLSTTERRTLGRPDRAYAAFGAVLALGDVDGDRRTDLLEGSPGAPEYSDDPPTPGHLTVTGDVARRTAVTGQLDAAPASLAIGDVTGDGYGDVVLGVPVNRTVGEDGRLPAGVVIVHPGGKRGLDAAPIRITQDRAGIPGANESGDRFGSSVAVTDVDGDRFDDIVVGARGEDRGRGRVTVVRGAARGFARSGNTAFGQDTSGVPGKARPSDLFGAAVSALDLDGDGRDDLAVGALGDRNGSGTITAFRGTAGGFAIAGARTLDLRRVFEQAPAFGYGFPELRLGRIAGS